MSTIDKVREFHLRMGQPIGTEPRIDPARVKLRLDLIAEEFRELCEACGWDVEIQLFTMVEEPREPDIIEAADALADLDYVITGTSLEFGIPHDAVVAEVHRSNMTKEPGHMRADGKILKGPNYSPPDVAGVLARVPPGVDYQPSPSTGDAEVWPLVLADIEARRAFGLAKYGVPLRTDDGRKSIVDAYQEALDLVVYLRKEIEERGP